MNELHVNKVIKLNVRAREKRDIQSVHFERCTDGTIEI